MTSVAHRKAKGRGFERSTAADVAEAFDLDEDDVLHAHPSDQGKDLHLSAKAKRFFPYWTECKNHKTLKLPAWIRQAEKGAEEKGEGLEPIVVFKQHRNRKKYVVMSFDHLLELRRLIGEEKWEPKKTSKPPATPNPKPTLIQSLASRCGTREPTKPIRMSTATLKRVASSEKRRNDKGTC